MTSHKSFPTKIRRIPDYVNVNHLGFKRETHPTNNEIVSEFQVKYESSDLYATVGVKRRSKKMPTTAAVVVHDLDSETDLEKQNLTEADSDFNKSEIELASLTRVGKRNVNKIQENTDNRLKPRIPIFNADPSSSSKSKCRRTMKNWKSLGENVFQYPNCYSPKYTDFSTSCSTERNSGFNQAGIQPDSSISTQLFKTNEMEDSRVCFSDSEILTPHLTSTNLATHLLTQSPPEKGESGAGFIDYDDIGTESEVLSVASTTIGRNRLKRHRMSDIHGNSWKNADLNKIWKRCALESAQRGDLPSLKKYLAHMNTSMIRNLHDEWGNNLWHYAARNNDLLSLRWLCSLPHGEEPLLDMNAYNVNPTVAAIKRGCLEVVQWIIKRTTVKRQVLDSREGERTLLHVAAKYGNTRIVNWLSKYMISTGCNLNQQDDRGYTAIHLAAKYNNFSCLKVLVLKSVDISKRDKRGMKAEDIARSLGFSTCADYLLALEVSTALAKERLQLEDELICYKTERSELDACFHDLLYIAKKLLLRSYTTGVFDEAKSNITKIEERWKNAATLKRKALNENDAIDMIRCCMKRMSAQTDGSISFSSDSENSFRRIKHNLRYKMIRRNTPEQHLKQPEQQSRCVTTSVTNPAYQTSSNLPNPRSTNLAQESKPMGKAKILVPDTQPSLRELLEKNPYLKVEGENCAVLEVVDPSSGSEVGSCTSKPSLTSSSEKVAGENETLQRLQTGKNMEQEPRLKSVDPQENDLLNSCSDSEQLTVARKAKKSFPKTVQSLFKLPMQKFAHKSRILTVGNAAITTNNRETSGIKVERNEQVCSNTRASEATLNGADNDDTSHAEPREKEDALFFEPAPRLKHLTIPAYAKFKGFALSSGRYDGQPSAKDAQLSSTQGSRTLDDIANKPTLEKPSELTYTLNKTTSASNEVLVVFSDTSTAGRHSPAQSEVSKTESALSPPSEVSKQEVYKGPEICAQSKTRQETQWTQKDELGRETERDNGALISLPPLTSTVVRSIIPVKKAEIKELIKTTAAGLRNLEEKSNNEDQRMEGLEYALPKNSTLMVSGTMEKWPIKGPREVKKKRHFNKPWYDVSDDDDEGLTPERYKRQTNGESDD